jgi:hypothetical protein
MSGFFRRTVRAGEMAQQKNSSQIQQGKKRSLLRRAFVGARNFAGQGARATYVHADMHQKGPVTTGETSAAMNRELQDMPWLLRKGGVGLAVGSTLTAQAMQAVGAGQAVKNIAGITKYGAGVGKAVVGESTIKRQDGQKMYAFFTKHSILNRNKIDEDGFLNLIHSNVGLSGLIKFLYELSVAYIDTGKADQNVIVGVEKEIEGLYALVAPGQSLNNVFMDPSRATGAESYPTTAPKQEQEEEFYNAQNETKLPVQNETKPYPTMADQNELGLNGGYKRKTRKGKKGKGKKTTKKRHHYKKTKRSKSKNTKRKTKRRHNKRK